MGYKVAVVGATGAVGREMLRVLEQRRFPVDELLPLASSRSAGQALEFRGERVTVRALDAQSFAGVKVALFSAGGPISRDYAPLAAAAGAVVIDNTSAFRMDPQVPLVVPEVNAEAARQRPKGIIANPNCSTIQLVVAVAPLHREATVRRIVVATYQAVAGAGQSAIAELGLQTRAWAAGEPDPAPAVFRHPILFDCLPQIGDFRADGDTVEERKLIDETRKILAEPALRVSATAVRVPVMIGHSEAVNLELTRPLTVARARELLSDAPGVELVDDPAQGRYPLARRAAGTDPVYVGRVRLDSSLEHGLNLWVVADNLRKGAALNAVQIAEYLVQQGEL
ncbi:MAG: aspartate-semialdehyde dehydrogenase [Proteobacteria bacterium]|nr:aspartate-semialdehyde dehydrogenase [Pseudomonadota bacterium]